LGYRAVGLTARQGARNTIFCRGQFAKAAVDDVYVSLIGTIRAFGKRQAYFGQKVLVIERLPSLSVSVAAESSPEPVITMTGQLSPRPLRRRNNSSPLISGMCKSVTMTPGSALCSFARKTFRLVGTRLKPGCTEQECGRVSGRVIVINAVNEHREGSG
jgi:hypothetical protein